VNHHGAAVIGAGNGGLVGGLDVAELKEEAPVEHDDVVGVAEDVEDGLLAPADVGVGAHELQSKGLVHVEEVDQGLGDGKGDGDGVADGGGDQLGGVRVDVNLVENDLGGEGGAVGSDGADGEDVLDTLGDGVTGDVKDGCKVFVGGAVRHRRDVAHRSVLAEITDKGVDKCRRYRESRHSNNGGWVGC